MIDDLVEYRFKTFRNATIYCTWYTYSFTWICSHLRERDSLSSFVFGSTNYSRFLLVASLACPLLKELHVVEHVLGYYDTVHMHMLVYIATWRTTDNGRTSRISVRNKYVSVRRIVTYDMTKVLCWKYIFLRPTPAYGRNKQAKKVSKWPCTDLSSCKSH